MRDCKVCGEMSVNGVIVFEILLIDSAAALMSESEPLFIRNF